MQKIALIQNQVYMSYASKSDVRPLVVKFGYKPEQVVLFTSHNISRLKVELDSGEIDAVIFTSNSLKEGTIKQEVESEAFQQSFSHFLNQGKGCLILHQLGLASASDAQDATGGTYEFLPQNLRKVKAVLRNEEANLGDFSIPRLSQGHPIFHYPNAVDPEALKLYCKKKKGLYWHYLINLDSSEWDVLLYDENQDSKRSLLISTKETSKQRVVIASLNLDWQREEVLFHNLLVYVLEGKCNTAILKDKDYNSMAFDFFLTTLKSKNYRYQEYDLAQLDDLKKHIEKGTHSIVVMGPTLLDNEEKIQKLQAVDQYLLDSTNEGKIKYIGIESTAENLKQFFVAGREKFALSILQDTEIKIQRVFQQKKLIDGSFWSSVDALKVLHRLERGAMLSVETIEPIFADVRKRSVDEASYDGLLVPTTSLLWLRATYFGKEAEQTLKTINWIKNALLGEDEAEIECVLAYNTLIELQIETEFAEEQLMRLIKDKDLIHNNEIEIVHYIKAAILLKDLVHIKRFISTLKSKRNEEMLWIDISISATIVNLLLDALVMLKEHSANTEEIEQSIEDMVFPTIIIMQSLENKIPGAKQYHWDNKANTTLKCVNAMLKFEELIDLPVTEMVQSLLSYTQTSHQLSDNNTALQMIEDFKNEKSQLEQRVQELETRMTEERQKQQELIRENEKYREEVQEYNNELKELRNLNRKFEDDIQRKDKHSGIWTFLTAAGVIALVVALLLAIFFFYNKNAYKELTAFYPWWKPVLGSFTAIYTILVFLLPKRKNNSTINL